MMALRWNVQEVAKPQRWSARRLAHESGLAYNTVWAIWTNRTQRVDLKTLDKLATTLGVEPGALIAKAEADGKE